MTKLESEEKGFSFVFRREVLKQKRRERLIQQVEFELEKIKGCSLSFEMRGIVFMMLVVFGFFNELRKKFAGHLKLYLKLKNEKMTSSLFSAI